ncbi:MAG: tricarballylate utilization protein TcuB, partial [Noviherbaspirillum sp.]
MQQLESLIEGARLKANPVIPIVPAALAQEEQEVNRQLQICNACRYCEGFCAVFPAMTRRLEFG